jgi:hypothetical protein
MIINGNFIKRERNNMDRCKWIENVQRDGKWSDNNVIRERERI